MTWQRAVGNNYGCSRDKGGKVWMASQFYLCVSSVLNVGQCDDGMSRIFLSDWPFSNNEQEKAVLHGYHEGARLHVTLFWLSLSFLAITCYVPYRFVCVCVCIYRYTQCRVLPIFFLLTSLFFLPLRLTPFPSRNMSGCCVRTWPIDDRDASGAHTRLTTTTVTESDRVLVDDSQSCLGRWNQLLTDYQPTNFAS